MMILKEAGIPDLVMPISANKSSPRRLVLAVAIQLSGSCLSNLLGLVSMSVFGSYV